MRIHTMAILGFVLSLMLIVAACNGDDDDAEDTDVTDDTTEDVTPADDDEATPEDGAMTPVAEATPDADETPGATPDGTPEDGAVVTDETPAATPDGTPGVGVTEPLMVQVTLTDTGIELQYSGGPDPDATPEATPDDDATPETTPEGDATPEMTPDAGITGPVTVPSGAYSLTIVNESDTERSLAYERVDGDGTMTGDATPEATPEDEATPDATPGAGMDMQELDEPLQPGDSTTWEIELEPGEYVFYDPINDHRDEGFEIEVTVEDLTDGGVTDDATPGATPEDDATPEATP